MVNNIYVCVDCELQFGQSELEATLHGKPKCYECNGEMVTVVVMLKLMSSSINDLRDELAKSELAVDAAVRSFKELRDMVESQPPTKRRGRQKAGAR